MEFITALPPHFHGLFILLVVMLLKFTLQAIAPHQPWQFFAFFCSQFANKVNKAENGPRQQTISGTVAVIITFAPLWVILWLFEDFVAIAFLWQALLLYLALGPLSLQRSSNKIVQAIGASNNFLAKDTLQSLVLRDTSKLSAMGIAKANIEMLIIKHMQQTVTVALLFLIGGGLLAISYRLILEMHYAWNLKLRNMEYFGRFANTLAQLFTWLPSRFILLCGLLLSFGQQSTLLWRLTMPSFFTLSNKPLLLFFALALNIRLGGVAMYKGIKLRREEFNNNGRQPEPHDISHCAKFLNRITILLFVFASACYAFSWLTISNPY